MPSAQQGYLKRANQQPDAKGPGTPCEHSPRGLKWRTNRAHTTSACPFDHSLSDSGKHVSMLVAVHVTDFDSSGLQFLDLRNGLGNYVLRLDQPTGCGTSEIR